MGKSDGGISRVWSEEEFVKYMTPFGCFSALLVEHLFYVPQKVILFAASS